MLDGVRLLCVEGSTALNNGIASLFFTLFFFASTFRSESRFLNALAENWFSHGGTILRGAVCGVMQALRILYD